MAITILPQARQSALSSLAGGFGTGLGSGLEALADMKMQQMQQQRQASQTKRGLLAIPGITPEMAEAYSTLPPQLLQPIIKQALNAPSEEGYYRLAQQQAGMPGQPNLQAPNAQSQMAPQPGEAPMSPGQPQGQPGMQQPNLQEAPGRLTRQGYKDINDQIQKNKEFDYKKEQDAKNYNLKSDEAKWAWNKDYIKEAEDKAQVARDRIPLYNRIEEIDKSDNVQDPNVAKILNTLGINFPALQEGDTEELNKIKSFLLNGIAKQFGGRATNLDVGLYVQGLPTSMNTKEGRRRLVNISKLFHNAEILQANTIDKIIKESGGIPPRDLRKRVESRMKSKLDKIYEKIEKGVNAQQESKFKVGQEVEGLPNPASVSPRQILVGSDGSRKRVVNGQWVDA